MVESGTAGQSIGGKFFSDDFAISADHWMQNKFAVNRNGFDEYEVFQFGSFS